MDWSDLPTLSSLRAFAAVAETGGYSRAAEKLNVTQAAIGQQVRALEAHLNTSLVERAGRGVALTPEGARLAASLETGFLAIRRGVDAIMGARDARPVHLSMSPAFAVEWLMPRLPEFQQRHPEITLLLDPTARLVELRPGDADIAIRYRDAGRAEEGAQTVLISDMVVVGARTLLEAERVKGPPDLTRVRWLQELGTSEVSDWFRRHGVAINRPLMISEMPGHLIMQAVRRGDGVTYTARAFFRDDIRAGRMVVLSSEQRAGRYCIETGSGAARPAVARVLNWLQSMAETVTEEGERPLRPAYQT